MHQQVSAERKKRAEILESEGSRQSAINVAEGQKQREILESEAYKTKQINYATGEAEAILLNAKATADSIISVAKAISSSGSSGQDAVSLNVAEKYVNAFGELAKKGNTIIVPSDVSNVAGMVSGIMGIFDGVKGNKKIN
jgi:regulator of protease activity HflC (stomatin/prohibitin superfamily)